MNMYCNWKQNPLYFWTLSYVNKLLPACHMIKNHPHSVYMYVWKHACIRICYCVFMHKIKYFYSFTFYPSHQSPKTISVLGHVNPVQSSLNATTGNREGTWKTKHHRLTRAEAQRTGDRCTGIEVATRGPTGYCDRCAAELDSPRCITTANSWYFLNSASRNRGIKKRMNTS